MRLDIADLMRQRGLAQVNAFGGGDQLAGIGDRDQRTQVTKLKHAIAPCGRKFSGYEYGSYIGENMSLDES
jgi:hypothetical protein